MNARRLSTAFLIALAVSGVCTWLLSRKMGAQAAERVVYLRYAAPSKALQAGEVITRDDLELVNWPANNPIGGAFAKTDDLVGRSALFPIDKDQPVTDKYLSAAGSGLGLAGKIPQGMRAIALHSDEVMGVAGFLFPGSHLDVLVTYKPERSPEPITFTVLQDAEVLAVGQKSQPDPDGKPVAATVVTLLLTPQDAERAVLASTQGAFHFVLRGGSDKVHVADLPITLSRLSAEPGLSGASEASGIPAASQRPRARAEHTRPAPSGVLVETIAGDKRTTDTFSGVR